MKSYSIVLILYFSNNNMEHYEVSPLSLPKSSPNNIKKNLQEDVQFDPKKHLDLTMPKYIKTLDGENVPFPQVLRILVGSVRDLLAI